MNKRDYLTNSKYKMDHKLDKITCRAANHWLSIIVIINAVLLSIIMTSCTKEQFTDEELRLSNLYSTGDQFKMVTNYADTLTFTIEDKKLKEAGGNYGTKYEILLYYLSINSINSGQHSGKFEIRSHPDSKKNLMFFSLSFGRTRISDYFDLKTATETVVIRGDTYSNANCNRSSCLSLDQGFLKFTKQSDTLVLLP